MSKENFVEEIEWINSERANLIVTDITDMYDSSDLTKVVGKTKRVTTAEASYVDLKYNLDIKTKLLDETLDKINGFKEDVAKLGKKPAMTGEMIRMQRNMQAMNSIDAHNKLEAQISEEQKTADRQQDWVDIRKLSLAKRPEPVEENETGPCDETKSD
jgi:Mg2+/Co2+ transporter CorC